MDCPGCALQRMRRTLLGSLKLRWVAPHGWEPESQSLEKLRPAVVPSVTRRRRRDRESGGLRVTASVSPGSGAVVFASGGTHMLAEYLPQLTGITPLGHRISPAAFLSSNPTPQLRYLQPPFGGVVRARASHVTAAAETPKAVLVVHPLRNLRSLALLLRAPATTTSGSR